MGCGFFKANLALVAFGAIALAPGAFAEGLAPTLPPPADCLDFMPQYGASGGLLDWRETVAVEHCDRIKRLWSLASRSYYGAPPQFFDGYVSSAQLPTDINVSLPLLRVVFPDRVFFDTARAELRPEAMEVVRVIAANLRMEPPDVVLFVAGHTDARGGRAYNQGLSVDRANAVADAILREGVNVARVWRVGFGEDMPLRAGDDETAWGENRRVEFLFAARAEAVAVWLEDAQIDMLCQGRTAAEVDACVNQLDLDTPYVAIETSQTNLNLSTESGRRTINPRGTNRIIINPTNRRSRQLGVNQ